jgi:hypothetical protein
MLPIASKSLSNDFTYVLSDMPAPLMPLPLEVVAAFEEDEGDSLPPQDSTDADNADNNEGDKNTDRGDEDSDAGTDTDVDLDSPTSPTDMFSLEGIKGYHLRMRYTNHVLRLYTNLWSLAKLIKENPAIDLKTTMYGSWLDAKPPSPGLLRAIQVLASFSESGTPAPAGASDRWINTMLDVTTLAASPTYVIRSQSGVNQPIDSYYKALLFCCLGGTAWPNSLLLNRISELFNDLNAQLQARKDDIRVALGDSGYKQLKSISTYFDHSISGVALDPIKAQKMLHSIDKAAGSYNAFMAYSQLPSYSATSLMPPTVEVWTQDPITKTLTVKTSVSVTSQAIARRQVSSWCLSFYKNYCWPNADVVALLQSKTSAKIGNLLPTVAELAALDKRVAAGTLKFYDPDYIAMYRSYKIAVDLVLAYYKHLSLANPNDATAAANFNQLSARVANAKSYAGAISEFYVKARSHFFRHDDRRATKNYSTEPYHTFCARLNELGIDDIAGPVPPVLDPSTNTFVQAPTPWKKTLKRIRGFDGRIDEAGQLYSRLARVVGKNNEHIGYEGNRLLSDSLGVGRVVYMNDDYSDIDDDTYLLEWVMEGGQSAGKPKRIYTKNFDARAKLLRTEKVMNDYFNNTIVPPDETVGSRWRIAAPLTFRKSWTSDIKMYFDPKMRASGQLKSGWVPNTVNYFKTLSHADYEAIIRRVSSAMVCELIYLTAMRVGNSESATLKNNPTFGATTLRRHHLAFSLVSNGSYHQVVGVRIRYPGKDKVLQDHILGRVHNPIGADAAAFHPDRSSHAVLPAGKVIAHHQTDDLGIDFISLPLLASVITPEERAASETDAAASLKAIPIFLYVLYMLWRYRYDPLTKNWYIKNNANDLVFTISGVQKSRGRTLSSTPAVMGSRDIHRYMKDPVNSGGLGMQTSAHQLRKFKGTYIALQCLFSEPAVQPISGGSPVLNPLYNDAFKKDNKGRDTTLSSKLQMAREYCDAVAEVVGDKLGHHKTIVGTKAAQAAPGGTLSAINIATSKKSYILPSVFIRYYALLGITNYPNWLKQVIAAHLGDEDSDD